MPVRHRVPPCPEPRPRACPPRSPKAPSRPAAGSRRALRRAPARSTAPRGRRCRSSGIPFGATESFALERDIVFHVVELAGGLFRCCFLAVRLRLAARLGLAPSPCPFLAPRTAAFPPPQHLHHVTSDIGRVAVLAVLVLPL